MTCAIGVPGRLFEGVYAAQENSMWCWAACISMLFRYYGYEVSQARVVQEGWGVLANLPGRVEQVIAAVNRAWVDDRGVSFRAYGQFFGVTTTEVGLDLGAGRPLIIGTSHHAMLLTSITVVRDARGNETFTEVIVRDPWPGQGRRALRPDELASARLLRVEVVDSSGQPVSRAPSKCERKVVPCEHPAHLQGDLARCQHACAGPYGAVVCHPSGDVVACGHPAHPQGHAVVVCD